MPLLIRREREPYLLLTPADMAVLDRLTGRMGCSHTEAVQRAIRHLDVQHRGGTPPESTDSSGHRQRAAGPGAAQTGLESSC